MTEETHQHNHEECNDHTHDHNHDHHEVDQAGISQSHKASKGEKKFKKAMAKMGMKPVEGITRVTLKTAKNFILYIDRPEVMKTNNDASYMVFGEAKFFDFGKNLANASLEKFKEKQPADATAHANDAPKTDGNVAPVEAGEISEDSIKTLMEYSNCTREVAIEALKKTGGDVVEAISSI